MIKIKFESILKTGFCNKIELGHFDLVILLSEYVSSVQLRRVFTSYYKQKARLFFKKEWRNWIKKLDIWKHPREYEKFWKVQLHQQ